MRPLTRPGVRRRLASGGLLLALAAASACDNGPVPRVSPIGGAGSGGSGLGSGGRPDGGGDLGGPGAGSGGAGGGSGFVEAIHPSEGAGHSNLCDPLTYGTSPPSSGVHYPVWAAYKTYAQPVPWGFLVHAMEHGGMILVYDCPTGCPGEVAAAQAWIDSLPPDAQCGGGRPRVILAPDPTLDCRWAAASWTWTLRGGAFDPAPFQRFFDRHYENPDPGFAPPEPTALCIDGVDRPADGWCP